MKSKNNFIVIILVVMGLALGYNYFFLNSRQPTEQHLSYTEFLAKLDTNTIQRASINGNLLKAVDEKGVVYLTAFPQNDSDIIRELRNKGVNISIAMPESASSGVGTFIVIALAIFLVFMIIRSLRGGGDNSGGGSPSGNNPFSFGKSKARLSKPEDSNITFADVAGVDEAKEDLEEMVDFLKNPKKFEKLGAKIPKGALLVGSPGTGKTLLAKAVAGEAQVPFFSISGSDFVEMFVGVGASRVRDLFTQAKKHAPCIVFIDEIDAVGRKRGVGIGGGNDEREQTLNQLLVEMDGFSFNQGIIILAATNRSDVLDPALLRPGRFDRQITVPLPDIIGREKILQIYLNKLPLDPQVNINVIARGTTGFSGAELANLVNEAALGAARKNREFVNMEDFEEARDKILMGAARKSSKMGEEERTLTAYHEAGHALVAFKSEGSYPVHKVTIIPRGRSLGVTSFIPEKDEYSRSYKQLTAQLAVLFGGRLAEELKFGKENITTGAAMDIQMATNLATKMITEWGFSDVIGRVRHVDNENGYGSRGSSESTAKEIEEEVRNLIKNAEHQARTILTENSAAHVALSEALLEYETLNGVEARQVCDGKTVEEIRNPKPVAEEEKKEEEDKPVELDLDLSVPAVG
ncbi:MAG: ATP-dependent zinc metalloprotease FtsH [Alphaproteobacteria bacterium]|nr:ATP-dependent zinc metalloprotease FtsH [Alphaproteobacteria bacterium]